MNTKTIIFAFFCVLCTPSVTGQSADYYKNITLAEIKNQTLSTRQIDGSASVMGEGTILAFETNAHRRGKMLIRKCGYDLVFDWITYSNDGKMYQSGINTTVKGTYRFDLDANQKEKNGFDFWWEQVDNQQRYLVPQNGAAFNIFKQTKFDIAIKVLEGPKTLKLGDTSFQVPLRVEVSSTVRIQAKVTLDLVLSKKPDYVEPAHLAKMSDKYQDGASITGGRIEVDFLNELFIDL